MRRILGISIVLAGLVLAAMPAVAQEEGVTAFTVRSIPGPAWADEGGARNPTFTVQPGATITVTVRNDDGGYHNFRVGTNDPSDYLDTQGAELTYTFTAPQSGTVEYICPVHPVEMKGTIAVAGTPVENGNDAPGLALAGTLVALLGVALLARRR